MATAVVSTLITNMVATLHGGTWSSTHGCFSRGCYCSSSGTASALPMVTASDQANAVLAYVELNSRTSPLWLFKSCADASETNSRLQEKGNLYAQKVPQIPSRSSQEKQPPCALLSSHLRQPRQTCGLFATDTCGLFTEASLLLA